MSDLGSVASEAGGANAGFEALASINEGFMGTGYSTSVELSFIAMALILAYVAVSTARYFLSGTNVMDSVTEALGLRD